MTPIKELFSGVGIVIDEQVFSQENKNINKIVSSLESANIPLVKYDKMPDDGVLTHLKQISFVLLDWNLSGERIIPPATIEDNINFIKIMRQQCFAPLFIFSDERLEDIEAKLEEENLYRHGQSNAIFIKHKEDVLTIDDLWREIEIWMKQTPSMYVAKEWECARTRALVEMLHNFEQASPYWPSVLQETMEHDGIDTGEELSHLLNKNLESRMQHVDFDAEIVKSVAQTPTKSEIRNVLETECFRTNINAADSPVTGDLFANMPMGSKKVFVNIRPICDTIRLPKEDKTLLYLIQGEYIKDERIAQPATQTSQIEYRNGCLLEHADKCYIAFVNGKVIEFNFKELSLCTWEDLKDKRIGRVLAPQITRLQQKYAFYLQRQGVPAIPELAFFDKQQGNVGEVADK